MAVIKAGTRLRSTVCETEIMVVSAPERSVEISCGGSPMIGMDEEPPPGQTLSADAAKGTALGKRYVNDSGDLEVLCTKPGDGSVAADGEILEVKEAKPLPSSD